WEETLNAALVGPAEDRQLALGQEQLRNFLERIRAVIDSAVANGEKPAVMTSVQIRIHIHSIIDRIRMNVPVIAQLEVHRRAQVKIVGVI
ncbi:MAG TPA: FHIPEP family type III secretion protein, partial [Rhodopila sp.]|nr:FHIPEP family type III secretion protein [Rhodopila sp.]